MNNSEFWSDLVLTYCTLVRNGFAARNIVVLYGDGNDHQTELAGYRAPYCDGSSKITDISLTNSRGHVVKDNICSVLCCMAAGLPSRQVDGKCVCSPVAEGAEASSCRALNVPRLTNQDFLFVWLKGHGAASGRRVYLQLDDQVSLTDVELKELMGNLAPRRQAWVFETCSSGGWLDEFSSGSVDRLFRRGRVALTASANPEETIDWSESSFPAYYLEPGHTDGTEPSEVLHGRFSYWINSAFLGEEPIGTVCGSDYDGNSLVSILEAYDAVHERIAMENQTFNSVGPTSGLGGEQHPGISARGSIGPCVFIGLADPSWYCRCFRQIPAP